LRIGPAVDAQLPYDYLQPEAPAILEGWLTDLWLDDADAKQLQTELDQLYRKYRGRAGARRYLMRIALAPLADQVNIPERW
jgi:hypothetical protein